MKAKNFEITVSQRELTGKALRRLLFQFEARRGRRRGRRQAPILVSVQIEIEKGEHRE